MRCLINIFSTDIVGCSEDANKYMYGKKYTKKSGIALETQFYPDAINHPNFPSPIVKANETFSYSTIYAFSVVED